MENINTAYMGTVFKTARLSAHLTQEEVAEKIGVTTRYIMALENENKHPSLDNLLKLVHALNIPADAILYPGREIVDNEDEQFIRMFCMLKMSTLFKTYSHLWGQIKAFWIFLMRLLREN